jgi:DNA-binding transcriptional ArsR family regulator
MGERRDPLIAADEPDEQTAAETLPQEFVIDRLIHEPARLIMMTVLNVASEVDFKFLEAATKLSRGNLSRQASKLEEAGYIAIRKHFRGKIPATSYRMTDVGRTAFARYWQEMQAIHQRGEFPAPDN